MRIIKLKHVFDGQHKIVVKFLGITIATLQVMQPSAPCACQGEVMIIRTPRARKKVWHGGTFNTPSPEPVPEDFVS